jgi:hypothetical protein
VFVNIPEPPPFSPRYYAKSFVCELSKCTWPESGKSQVRVSHWIVSTVSINDIPCDASARHNCFLRFDLDSFVSHTGLGLMFEI